MSRPRHARQDSAADGRSGVLTSRLLDVDLDTFARDIWARRAHLTRTGHDFSDLFSAAAVDELIAERGLRTPFLRIAKNGSTVSESRFTAPGGVGAEINDQVDDTALWRQFAEGATIVLQALHRTWAPVADFTTQLAAELGHPVQANAYITPPQNRGFDDHYDVHDVFVLQVEGTKRWVIHEPVHPAPLREQPWTDHREQVAEAARTEPIIDTVLEPGDVLYLPRGWLHAAEAQGAVSIHLTLGVHVWTQYALAEQLVRSALDVLRDDPAMRASLALGVQGPDDQLAPIRDRLTQAIAEADPTDTFHRVRRRQGRPAPLGPLAQLEALDQLVGDTPLRLREGLAPRLVESRLETRVGWLDFANEDLPRIRDLLAARVRTADQLGLALAERLLRAGVLIPAPLV
ncbi:cupin domain-containing protein [Propionibacteriaceae bacterium Y1685]|uniref:cupin domain-containing protein n=1 Tax=Microlunatus sp. Y1700 TaxID=3418487 RepID=UPI003B768110